jgi:hypothetical protein
MYKNIFGFEVENLSLFLFSRLEYEGIFTAIKNCLIK